MFKHDPQHTGYTDCEMPDELELLWKFETGGTVYSSPSIADGKVYFGSHDSYLYCLDSDTGKLLWKYETGSFVFSSPAVVDGKIYFGSLDSYLYCFGARSNTFLYLGVFVGAIILILAIYQITKKKPEKPKEEPIEKKPEEKPKPSEKPPEEISPELKKLLEEKAEWREKLEDLKREKDDLIKRGLMSEKTYQQRYEEIMDQLVDIEDKIIQERMKRGGKK